MDVPAVILSPLRTLARLERRHAVALGIEHYPHRADSHDSPADVKKSPGGRAWCEDVRKAR